MLNLLLGILSSIIAAALFPAFTDSLTGISARLLGWLPLQGRLNLSGPWQATWHVQSSRFPESVSDSSVTVRQFFNRIYVKFQNEDLNFQAKGVIDSNRYVTGTWSDSIQGGYHGAFQLIIDPKSRNMRGLWIGYSTAGMVKHGEWIWER